MKKTGTSKEVDHVDTGVYQKEKQVTNMTTIEALAALVNGLSTDEKTELLSLVDRNSEKSN